MKHNLITLTALSAAFIAAAALAGCQRENIDPEVSAIEEGTEVIPVWVEGMPDTKMTVNATTGICAWEENDPVALYISGTGANKYVNYPVVDGSVRLSLASGQSRANYAIYPTTAAYASGYTTPTVMYPTTYNMALIPEANYADWCPAPMVAVNSGAALKFYHVGALVKVTISYVPAGTKTIVLTFTGKTVTGNFSVSNAGSADASATTTSSSNSTVTFNNLNITGSSVTLNVPIPLGDYSSLTAISANMKNSGGTSLFSVTNPVSGWGAIAHGQGKRISIVATTISGGNGLIRGFEISKGFLKWEGDSTTGHYTLTDGEDPLEMIQYYHKAAADGVYFHRFNSTDDSMKYRLDNNYTVGQGIQNPTIVVDGQYWTIPSASSNTSDFVTIFAYYNYTHDKGKDNTDFSTPILNGSEGLYAKVLIDLSDATPENGASIDYSSKGLTTVVKDGSGKITSWGSVGNADGSTGYQAGVLLFPDGSTITTPNITTVNSSSKHNDNVISYSVLKQLVNGGCSFWPTLGVCRDSGWAAGGTDTYYLSKTNSSNTTAKGLSMYGETNVNTGDNFLYSDRLPVKLVR